MFCELIELPDGVLFMWNKCVYAKLHDETMPYAKGKKGDRQCTGATFVRKLTNDDLVYIGDIDKDVSVMNSYTTVKRFITRE